MADISFGTTVSNGDKAVAAWFNDSVDETQRRLKLISIDSTEATNAFSATGTANLKTISVSANTTTNSLCGIVFCTRSSITIESLPPLKATYITSTLCLNVLNLS